ncbi:MAG: class I SAM-dependent methyltransferase [Solirubrobacteraceae bacterium]|nr:class I SAM-dependent methyltransferase [Solirubrobacteraceae bacterium]
MARPQLPFRTDHPKLMQARERLADVVYPGGLQSYFRLYQQGRRADGGVAEPGADLELAAVAQRTAAASSVLTLDGPLVRDLTGRITDEQRAELLERLTPDQRGLWDSAAGTPYQPILAVTFGLFHDVPGIAEATGLHKAMPPADVHAMAHVAQATGGDLGYADAVDQLLTKAGVPIGDGTRVLDFGCSSGRVARVLAAYHPGATFHGCDPNGPAIAWAQEHLPEVSFFQSPQRPPVDLPDGSLDAAYAISIWSHFNAEPGLLWLAEMARLIRSGGAIVFSTHGFQSIATRAARGESWSGALVQAADDMYTSGFSFFNPFGEDGDWGVVDADWGMAFLTPEWLMPRIQDEWFVDAFHPAALEGDQDLWVLRRR